MDIHYNAFISYRHHPDDIRVAAEIHRLLEHYKVPRAIRKQSKGITRLFRDKEELPITSNLTDDITRALENSDYLIVICSTHTRESTWVQREIETFLLTHDRSRILTVLVDGEPYETIPETLLYEEQVDPATGQVKRVPIEPLSCDWRIPRRKARQEELPRLAAALLNCGYNELRQRERQYRMRRMVTAFSAALAVCLCFMAYFLYSNLQIQRANEQLQDANARIQENLNQALKNQSMFLGNESLQLLDDGDRLTAIALALEALPEYEGERPYVASAELALSQAVGAYDVNFSIVSIGAMECGALVRDFVVTDDGKILYTRDARSMISVWNTETFQRLGSLTLDFLLPQMKVTNSGNLLIYESYGQLFCCGSDGSILWSVSDCGDVAFLDDKNILMLLDYESTAFGEPYLCTIRFVEPDTGEEVREPLTFSDSNGTAGSPHFLLDSYSGGTPVCLEFSRYSDDYSYEISDIHVLDLQAGTCTYLTTLEDIRIDDVGFTADGNLLLMTCSPTFSLQGSVLDMLTTCETKGTLYCIDSSTGARLWETEIVSYVYSSCSTLETIPGSTNLLFQYNNVFHIIDSGTGEVLTRCETTSSSRWTRVDQEFTLFILEDGSYGSFRYEDAACSSTRYMKDNLNIAALNNGIIYAYEGLQTQVVAYCRINDENYRRYDGDYDYIYDQAYAASGNLMAIEDSKGVYVFDAEAQSLLWCDAGEEYTSDLHILGFSGDGNTLYCYFDDYSTMELVAYDAHTGAAERTAMPEKLDGNGMYIYDHFIMHGSSVFFIAKHYGTDEWCLLRVDAVSGEYEYWPICIPEEKDYYFYEEAIPMAVTDTYALVWENSTETIYEIEFATGEVRTVATEVPSLPVAEVYSDTQYILAVNNEIQLRTFAGEAQLVNGLGEKKAGAFCLFEDQLLAICDDGDLYRYSMDGTQLSSTELHLYTTFYTDLADDPSVVRWFVTGDGDLIINADGYGNVVDCSTWQLRATLPNFIAYDPVRNVMVEHSSAADINGIISYPRYTTEEIMSQAKEALNGFELTADQKAAYGLSEDE